MLTLTRRPGESIHTSIGLTVRVVSCRNGQVRLGFNAPEDIGIWRDELNSAVEQSNLKGDLRGGDSHNETDES